MPVARAAALSVVLAVLTFHLGLCEIARAQAWTPAKGEGAVGVSYQWLEFRGHYLSEGQKDTQYPYRSRTQAVHFELEYGITDKLAFDLRLPYVASRYTDQSPGNTPADLRLLFDQVIRDAKPGSNIKFLDDGTYNATFQDLRAGLRYKLVDRPFVLTPFVAVTVPSHDYPTIGESSPGRGLREFHAGLNLARTLDPILSRAYIHAQYGYTAVERVLDVSTHRSEGQLTLGYFIKPSLSVRVAGSWAQTHGGLTFLDTQVSPELNLQHEKLLKVQFWHLGGGLTYSVRQSVDLYASFVSFLTGKETHYGSALTFGVSWGFSRSSTAPTSNQSTLSNSLR